MQLDSIWFLREPIDFEHKQYLLMAYLRDAREELKSDKLGLYYDIKALIQGLECFRTTRSFIADLSPKDRKIVREFNKLPDNEPSVKEVNKIVKWATSELETLRKEYNVVWRKVESAFNLYYVGEKPLIVDSGFLLVKYGGSPIIETYKFSVEMGKVNTELYEYIEGDYLEVKDQLQIAYPGSVFIVAESLNAFNTNDTAMPFLLEVMQKKVITEIKK